MLTSLTLEDRHDKSTPKPVKSGGTTLFVISSSRPHQIRLKCEPCYNQFIHQVSRVLGGLHSRITPPKPSSLGSHRRVESDALTSWIIVTRMVSGQATPVTTVSVAFVVIARLATGYASTNTCPGVE